MKLRALTIALSTLILSLFVLKIGNTLSTPAHLHHEAKYLVMHFLESLCAMGVVFTVLFQLLNKSKSAASKAPRPKPNIRSDEFSNTNLFYNKPE